MSKKRGDDEDLQATAVVTPRPQRPPELEITQAMAGPRPSQDTPTIVTPAPGGSSYVPTGSNRSKMPAQIGKYQILERVGRGGMGVLYRGVDPVLDREVAIKVMLGDFADDTEQLRPRFYREAKAVAKLQHRNIVTVFEFAEEGTTPFIVMEFLRGTSLQARLEAEPPLTLDDKLDTVAQLCAGLGYAHEQGIVHRDVKPANIFLLTDSTVKLLDFGIAKLTTSNLTRQGDVLGSPSYMSPEQVLGKENVDGRADVFSAGVVLFELLAGRKPFEGDTTTAIVLKILHEEAPAVDAVHPGIPSRLAAVVKRALEKDPEKRYATAGDFARDLQLVRRSLTTTEIHTIAMSGPIGPDTLARGGPKIDVAPPQPPKRSWVLPVGIAASVLAAAAVAVTMMGRPKPPPPGPGGTTTTTTPAPTGTTDGRTVSPPPPPKPPDPITTPPSGANLQVTSEPAGASISIDGKDTKLVTPASIALAGTGPHRLRLSKRGFQSLDAKLTSADVDKGNVSYTLAAAEVVAPAAQIAVTATGAYPFAIFDGGRALSAASTLHQVNIPVGKKVRLVANEYSLNQTVTVEATADKKFDIKAPELGTLTLRSTLETCKLRIGDRDLGYPPVNNISIAAGVYQVDLVCPNGQNKSSSINVSANRLNRAIVP
jgi:eukaryotic-like serine/threonine-protein kinase